MQRIYPLNYKNVFGIFDTLELAEIEVNKAIKALCIAYPKAHKKRDSLGNYTVYVDYTEKECIQFNINSIEKNKQLSRAYMGDYNTLKNNGWESNGKEIFMWQ